MEITSKANVIEQNLARSTTLFQHVLLFSFQCDGCIRTCDHDLSDCYVIDNNGYIILSERDNDTGKFFGQVEGTVMQALVDMEIFQLITLYDLQALCSKEVPVESDGSILSVSAV